jgi:hypothetical protein
MVRWWWLESLGLCDLVLLDAFRALGIASDALERTEVGEARRGRGGC